MNEKVIYIALFLFAAGGIVFFLYKTIDKKPASGNKAFNPASAYSDSSAESDADQATTPHISAAVLTGGPSMAPKFKPITK